MDIRYLPIFKQLDNDTYNDVIKSSKIYQYKIGQPICLREKIPSQIQIIVEGNGRLLSTQKDEKLTAAKLGIGSIIGLCSLINAKGCEEVNASSEVKVLSIPDLKIIQLYSKNKNFRSFCNSNIFPGEILSLAEILTNKSKRSDIDIKAAFNTLAKNSSILNFNSIS